MTKWILLGSANRPGMEMAEVFSSKEEALKRLKQLRALYTIAFGGDSEQVDSEEAPDLTAQATHPLASKMQELGALPVHQEFWIALGWEEGWEEGWEDDFEGEPTFGLILLEDPSREATRWLENATQGTEE